MINVGYSTRLGPISQVERDLLSIEGVRLVEMELLTKKQLMTEGLSADYLIVGAVEPLSREVLSSLERLRLVVRRGAGMDNVDVQAACELGIGVANVPDASVEEVSDHALALAMCLIRRIPTITKAMAQGKGNHIRVVAERAPRTSLLTVGVVGLGLIGSRFAHKARSLFGDVVGFDSVERLIDGVTPVRFEKLLEQSDVISVHVPLNSETRGMFDEVAFERMKPGCLFVNTSRGEVVVEAALQGALASGKLAGAGLDVTVEDPPSFDNPLLGYENVVHTVHTAGLGQQASMDLRRRSVESVVSALKGQYPESMLNPEVWTEPPKAVVERPS